MSLQDEARAGRFHGSRIETRQVTELVGIARGLIADGELNDFEIEFLHKWLAANSGAQSNPMIGLLLERIRAIYEDGFVDESERADLHDTLTSLTGNDFELGEVLKSTSLPITEPQPNIDIEGRKFCFTGTFTFGKRSACEAAVQRYGGVCVSGITWETDYLVIGEYATNAWNQSAFGGKIEKAIEYRSKGAPIAIVSEVHWRNYI